MNLVSIADLSEAQRRETRDFALRLKVLRQRRPDLYLEAMKRARGFAPCDAEPSRIAKQIHQFGRALADLEAEAEAPVLEQQAEGAVDHDGARHGDDHGDGVRESVLRLGVAWAAGWREGDDVVVSV